MKKYLKNGERVYCDGVYLFWNEKKECWDLDVVEDTIYLDGQVVEFDEKWIPYLEED